MCSRNRAITSEKFYTDLAVFQNSIESKQKRAVSSSARRAGRRNGRCIENVRGIPAHVLDTFLADEKSARNTRTDCPLTLSKVRGLPESPDYGDIADGIFQKRLPCCQNTNSCFPFLIPYICLCANSSCCLCCCCPWPVTASAIRYA